MPDQDSKPTPIETSNDTAQPQKSSRMVAITLFVVPIIIVIVIVVLLLLPAFTPDTVYANIVTVL